MNCEEFEELLVGSLAEMGRPIESEAMRVHRQSCGCCDRTLADYTETLRLCSDAAHDAPPSGVEAASLRKVLAASRLLSRHGRRRFWMPVAASVMILVATAFFLLARAVDGRNAWSRTDAALARVRSLRATAFLEPDMPPHPDAPGIMRIQISFVEQDTWSAAAKTVPTDSARTSRLPEGTRPMFRNPTLARSSFEQAAIDPSRGLSVEDLVRAVAPGGNWKRDPDALDDLPGNTVSLRLRSAHARNVEAQVLVAKDSWLPVRLEVTGVPDVKSLVAVFEY